MNEESIWQETLNRLQMQMTQATFETWLKNTRIVDYKDNVVTIGTENAFAKDWLENRLSNTISRTLNDILGYEISVNFRVTSEVIPPSAPITSAVVAAPPPSLPVPQRPHQPGQLDAASTLQLNSKYTFEQFVVGSSNRLAHAASMAVAESPAEAYNPLFLYGGVGLGKTHLLQAIAHVALTKHLRVIYITSENFTNDMIDAIRSQSTDAFREKYRNTDFLLIDDIQFIAGKESTQEELFHTFNALHSSGKQLVLSSDRPPKAIHSLEDRLLSRFEWGLLADLQPPDLETRIAILRFKTEVNGLGMPNDVIEFIAQRAQNNIRELEGAYNKVVAHARMSRQQISLAQAMTALKDIVVRRSELTVEQVIQAVSKFYRLNKSVLLGRKRTKEVALARQMAMYLAREETEASLPQIGDALGGRDHTTIKHGWEKLSRLVEENDQIRREMLAMRELIYADNHVNVF